MSECINSTAVYQQIGASLGQPLAGCCSVAAVAEGVAGDEEALLGRPGADVVLGGVVAGSTLTRQGVFGVACSIAELERCGIAADHRGGADVARFAGHAGGVGPDRCAGVAWGTGCDDIDLAVGMLAVADIVVAGRTSSLIGPKIRTGRASEVKSMGTGCGGYVVTAAALACRSVRPDRCRDTVAGVGTGCVSTVKVCSEQTVIIIRASNKNNIFSAVRMLRAI